MYEYKVLNKLDIVTSTKPIIRNILYSEYEISSWDYPYVDCIK